MNQQVQARTHLVTRPISKNSAACSREEAKFKEIDTLENMDVSEEVNMEEL